MLIAMPSVKLVIWSAAWPMKNSLEMLKGPLSCGRWQLFLQKEDDNRWLHRRGTHRAAQH